MNATVAVPVWLCTVAFTLFAGWLASSAIQNRALRDLYEMYRHDRDTLTVQLHDAFVAGWQKAAPERKGAWPEAHRRYPWAATNAIRRPTEESTNG